MDGAYVILYCFLFIPPKNVIRLEAREIFSFICFRCDRAVYIYIYIYIIVPSGGMKRMCSVKSHVKRQLCVADDEF